MDPHQTKIYTAILISSFLLGFIIISFFVSLVRHQKRNMELNRMNILSEITTLEKEHTRMARDLHDELGPILTSVKFNIDSVEVASADELIRERASRQIDEAIGRIREISSNLMPVTLIRNGLKEALEDFISPLQSPVQIRLLYHMNRKLDDEKNLHIYRLLKEIIQNTVKHSEAKNLVIRLEENKNLLLITCEDNGKGFDYENTLLQHKGIGLRNLKSRVELMGGRLDIYSVTGKGTQYKITIPFSKAALND